MPPATLLLTLALCGAVHGRALPIVPRAMQAGGPVWEGDNSLDADGRVVFGLDADRRAQRVLDQPLLSLLDDGVAKRLEALAEPRLTAVLQTPAHLLVSSTNAEELRDALERPAFLTLSARVADVLRELPPEAQAVLSELLRQPLRNLLRPRDVDLIYRSFVNTPDIPTTCPPGQSVARDGGCRPIW